MIGTASAMPATARAASGTSAAPASAGTAVEVDRFLVAGEDPAMWEWFLRCLYPAHGGRNRVRRAALLAAGRRMPSLLPAAGRILARDPRSWGPLPAPENGPGPAGRDPWAPALELLAAARDRVNVGRLAGPAAEAALDRGRWILVREPETTAPERDTAAPDRGTTAPEHDTVPRDCEAVARDCEAVAPSRGRLLLFPFPPGADGPAAVIKLARAGPDGRARDRTNGRGGRGRLALEALALAEVRRRLRGPLLATVPAALGFEEAGGIEALAQSALPGPSAYAEVQGLLAPRWRVAPHFRAAADWLGRFHRATRRPGRGPEGPAAAHGDFWARNLLVDPSGAATGVVDWEAAAPEGDPFGDLFHFPAAYGLAFPWERYRQLPAVEALLQTFLGRGRVAAGVRLYFRRYREITGLRPERLRRAFTGYVRTRAEGAARVEGAAWAELAGRLAAGVPSVIE